MINLMKRITVLVTSLVLMLGIVSIPVYATGNVTFEGESEGFIFKPGSNNSPSNLFENFMDIVPGDELEDRVEVKNNSNKTVKIYMKALGAESGSEAFLNQMGLVVKKESEEIFNSTADATAQLTDWVLLGEFHPNDKQLLDIVLSIPIEMNDDYQDAIGYLNWSFKVEEETTPPPGNPPKVPNTGVHDHLTTYSSLFTLSISAVVIILHLLVKDKKENNA